MRTLLIFDIDGTLLQTRAGRRAFSRAFESLYGLAEAAGSVPMAGRTDLSIFGAICGEHRLDPKGFSAWKQAFLLCLEEELQAEPGQLLPGVRELLEACSLQPDLTLALGTGNVEEGARLKLGRHDLNRFFAAGGFGSDGHAREAVIAQAIARSEAHHGFPFDRRVVIGDTPLDVACAHATGCLGLAVATGPFTMTDLGRCGADLLLPDLTQTDRLVAWFRGDSD